MGCLEIRTSFSVPFPQVLERPSSLLSSMSDKALVQHLLSRRIENDVQRLYLKQSTTADAVHSKHQRRALTDATAMTPLTGSAPENELKARARVGHLPQLVRGKEEMRKRALARFKIKAGAAGGMMNAAANKEAEAAAEAQLRTKFKWARLKNHVNDEQRTAPTGVGAARGGGTKASPSGAASPSSFLALGGLSGRRDVIAVSSWETWKAPVAPNARPMHVRNFELELSRYDLKLRAMAESMNSGTPVQQLRATWGCAFSHEQLGNFAAALDGYSTCLRMCEGANADDEIRAGCLFNRSVVYNQVGLPAAALTDLSEAIRLRPGVPDYHANRAILYRRLQISGPSGGAGGGAKGGEVGGGAVARRTNVEPRNRCEEGSDARE